MSIKKIIINNNNVIQSWTDDVVCSNFEKKSSYFKSLLFNLWYFQVHESTIDYLTLNLPLRCLITAASFSLTEVMGCFVIFRCLPLLCTCGEHFHSSWQRPAYLCAQLRFRRCSDSTTMFHNATQDNWPTPIRWQRLSSMIWWWSSPRSSRQDQTRSAKPRSPSISQLHRALSHNVKRLLAPVITLRQGTAGNRDRMCCMAVPEQEVEEKTLFLLHQAQHDCLCSEPMPDPQRAEILPWPHHTLGLTKHFMA